MNRRRMERGARLLPVLAAASLAGCADAGPGGPAGDATPDSAAVAAEAGALGAAETVLAAISSADGTLARSVVLPYAHVSRVTDGGVRVLSGEEFAAGISDPEQGFTERMWMPEVRVQGSLASVWAPYDFYVHGEFSHCGVDAFHLVRVGNEWRVQGLVYTVQQPPDCRMHPDGPPA